MMSDYYDQCRFYGGPIHYQPGASGYCGQDYDSHEWPGQDFEPIPRANDGPAETESLDASVEVIDGDLLEDGEVQHVTQPSTPSQPAKLQQLSINLINPQRKSEGSVKKLRNTSLSTVLDLKDHVCSCLKVPDIDQGQFELGYYEPGHGTKGKKRWLTCDEDMEDMKELYKKKKTEVLLWCYDPSMPRVGKKRCRGDSRSNEHDPDQPAPKSKSRSRFENAYEKKMSQVEEIYEKLREKHGKKFKPEQLRAWANMMQLDKHSSLDEPPSGRFFKFPDQKQKSKSPESISEMTVQAGMSKSPPESTALSPAKRVTLRTQCIEQLERWHSLMKSGGITKEQYADLQASILSEVKKY